MENEKLLQQITERYLQRILHWAVKKTGNRYDGEDLALEAMVQIFTFFSKNKQIIKQENAVWKIAHYVWCSRLRQMKKEEANLSFDNSVISDEKSDFTEEIIETLIKSEDLRNLRREIANLSFLQRQAMILHYLDGLPLTEVARLLSTTEGAIKWHLFDARKRVKKELTCMKEDTSYVYRPGRLSLGISGIPGPDPDTRRVNESLIKQNICLLCRAGKTIDELADCTGIPKPYLEFELDWLLRREFLKQNGKRYTTDFGIVGKRHAKEIAKIYFENRQDYIDRILDYMVSSMENIRMIGFYGADFPEERLLWALLTLFTSYFSRESKTCARLKMQDDRNIRQDGGRYYIVGNDLSDGQGECKAIYQKPEGWQGYNGIYSDGCIPGKERDGYYWLGLYNFKSSIPDVVNRNLLSKAEALHKLLCLLILPGFDESTLDGDSEELLAEQVQKGFVKKIQGRYLPQCCIFTEEELKKLQNELFAPLLAAIEPKAYELAQIFSEALQKEIPAAGRGYLDYFTYLDIWQTGIFSFIFSAQDGKLLIPKTPEEGAPLTLILVR